MKKYITKPIDYTGCHPVIAEHLKRGEGIKCNCWDDSGDSCEATIIAYNRSTLYRYQGYGDGKFWRHAEPITITTETRVKKASEIVKWLEDNGWQFKDGAWRGCYHDDVAAFTPHMFAFCGEAKPKAFWWHHDWTEEVTEGAES